VDTAKDRHKAAKEFGYVLNSGYGGRVIVSGKDNITKEGIGKKL
jgi:hypothetical protein